MIYTEIADEDMMGISVRKEDPLEEQWKEFGDIKWIIDEHGYKKLTYTSNSTQWNNF